MTTCTMCSAFPTVTKELGLRALDGASSQTRVHVVLNTSVARGELSYSHRVGDSLFKVDAVLGLAEPRAVPSLSGTRM